MNGEIVFEILFTLTVVHFFIGLLFRKKGETLKETLLNGADVFWWLFLCFIFLMIVIGFIAGVGELIISFVKRIWL